jgi:transposase-like protein
VSTNGVISTGRRRRRHHSELFKAEAVGACQQEGVSIAAVALARGVNASLLRRWVAEASGSGTPIAIHGTVPVMPRKVRTASFRCPYLPTPRRARYASRCAAKVGA